MKKNNNNDKYTYFEFTFVMKVDTVRVVHTGGGSCTRMYRYVASGSK